MSFFFIDLSFSYPYSLSLHDALPIFTARFASGVLGSFEATRMAQGRKNAMRVEINGSAGSLAFDFERMNELELDRKSTRLNSSHVANSYAVFCLKKKR